MTQFILQPPDKDPLKEDGYYRLKINKTDGTYTYSNIILVTDKGLNATTFVVYPNPVQQQNQQEVTVVLENLVPDENIQFFVSDLTGRRLMEQEFTVEADGRLTLTVPVAITEKLQSGIYMLMIVATIKKISRKLVVQ